MGTVTGNVGYTLTTEMSNIWGTDGSFTKVVSKYNTDAAGRFTTLQTAIDKIVVAVQEMAKASEEKAKEDVKETETKIPTTTPEPTPAPSTPAHRALHQPQNLLLQLLEVEMELQRLEML